MKVINPLIIRAALGLAFGITLSVGAAEISDDVLHYEFGDSREPLSAISAEIREAVNDSEELGEWEERLMTILEHGSLYAIDFASQELALIGTSRSVPALAKLLDQPKRSDMARYALERIPGQEAGEALVEALGRTGGAERLGIIHSLGQRRENAAVSALLPHLRSGDESVARAAGKALGKIGGHEASEALGVAMGRASSTLRPALADAYLASAERLVEQGARMEAIAIFEELYSPAEADFLRAAALVRLVNAREDAALPLVLDLLQGDDPLHQLAGHYVRTVPGTIATKAFADRLEDLPSHGKQILLQGLGDRGDVAALPAVIEATRDSDVDVRIAALQAIEGIGGASMVPLLASAASSGSDAERNAARRALARLRGADVNASVVSVMDIATPATQVELIRALGERHATDSVPALLLLAREGEPRVRVESLRVLRDLANVDHQVELVALLLETPTGEERSQAENAVVEASRRGGASGGAVMASLEAYEDTSDDSLRLSLVRVLGRLGDNQALEALHDAARDGSPELRDAAIRALADWPNSGPMEALEDFAASEAESDVHRVLSLRGYIRMVDLPDSRSTDEKVVLYERALEIASRPDEKVLVISRLGDIPSTKALDLVRKHLDDEDLEEAATVAVEKIEAAMQ